VSQELWRAMHTYARRLEKEVGQGGEPQSMSAV